jgi:hypothetical protein
MDRETAGPPLRFAPVGMTISLKFEDFARVNKVTDSRDDKKRRVECCRIPLKPKPGFLQGFSASGEKGFESP